MFKLSTSRRLAYWKNFRNQLGSMPLKKALEATQQLWQLCPFTPFYLNIEQPDSWPNPWELISENYYCDLAKCLGIVYTLSLTKHIISEPEIHIYRDSETRLTYHLAVFGQGKYVINLVDGEVVNIKSLNKTMQLQYRYTYKDLKIE